MSTAIRNVTLRASLDDPFSDVSAEESPNRHENGVFSVAAGGSSKSGRPDFELLV